MSAAVASPGIKAMAAEPSQTQPNVLFIYADDLGYGDLECYGAKNVKTPNVNRLASNGIRFTDGYAVAATSTPSRFSMLTGLYSWRRPGTDIAPGNAGMIIRPNDYTIADMFKGAGYTTCAIGKWHLGLGDKTGKQDWNAPLPTGLGDIGFDYSYIMAATADRVPCVFIENGQVANYDPSAPIEVSYKANFPGEPTGKDNPELLYNLKPTFGHDMSIVNGISRIGYMKGGGKALWKDENIADSITKHAVDFIKSNTEKPFFMYFATNDVHVPRFPHDRFRGKNKMGLRGDAIAQFDWTVGQLISTLEELNLLDNTLIILSSDNGPVLNDGYDDQAAELLNGHSPTGGLRGNKYSLYEGGTRVPVIVHWPAGNLKKGVNHTIISQIDLLASLASMLGQRIPAGAAPDSFNRIDNWLGRDNTDRPWVVQQGYDHTLALRTRDWKYIDESTFPKMKPRGAKVETGCAPIQQLFDMRKHYEDKSVAAEHPDITGDMYLLLQKIVASNYNELTPAELP
ncbi:MAG: sulfatase-like hydrolase/transferase [Muribaculaceae bacterium]|nr:sulfatase-like hydrolase/transferase [Muribaculaceae bacterium]